jgi:hypothetical protein
MPDWKESLDQFFAEARETEESRETTELARFIRDVAMPAFEQLREQLAKHGREMTVRETASAVTIAVQHGGNEELSYRIHGRQFTHGILPYAEVRFKERKGLKIIRVESMLRSGTPDYRIEDLTDKDVIQNFLDHYMRAVKPG